MVEIELRSLVCKNEFVNVDGYYNNDILRMCYIRENFFSVLFCCLIISCRSYSHRVNEKLKENTMDEIQNFAIELNG
ncbi:hypothetical protein [Pseudanabaena sp. Chao 1811]|uniref:hypothetical protein n=1 Tax=Pseudanabaena sp. Chao 1811 TaxID=2963092 RepID=UPI0022F3C57D|nr:hypothetical protein [Pseudanabaena sp. Chao 1811]